MRTYRLILAAILGSVALAGCSAHHTPGTPKAPGADLPALAARYPTDLARAKEAGIAVSVAEFAKPDPPADRNAATYYDQLARSLGKQPLVGRDTVIAFLAGPVHPTQSEVQLGGLALTDRPDLVKLAHQAATSPDCYFEKDWKQPNPALVSYPEMVALDEASHILTAESLVIAAQGRPLDAVRNQALGFRIADQAATEPTLTGYFLATGVANTTVIGLQKILYAAGDDPKVARAAERAIAQGFRPPSLARALSGESAFQQSTIRYLRQAGFSQIAYVPGEPHGSENMIPPTLRQAGSPGWKTFLDANGAFEIEEMIPLVTSADRSYPEAKQAMEEANRELAANPNDLAHFFADFQVPASVQLPDQRAKLAATAYVTQAGAAVLAWRDQHGEYPLSLSLAMARVPIDPYSGKPLGYRREGKGFVVYSVGPWGTFNGGSPAQAPSQLDTAFRYPLPAYLAPAR